MSALADPTRRRVIELLRSEPRRAGDLAEALSMSPPAMSRHLRLLRKTGLVEEKGLESDARVRVYRLCQDAFSELRVWLNGVDEFMPEHVDAFKDHDDRARRRQR